METVLITHTDLDGIASGALILKKVGNINRVYFTQPQHLHSKLSSVPNGSEVYITDLGVNGSTLGRILTEVRRIISSGGKVLWFDHHVWDLKHVEELSNAGVKLFIDRSTCGTGVVAKYLNVSDSEELVKVVCSADLWLMNDWRSNFLTRYVGFKGGSSWKLKIMHELTGFNGEISKHIMEVVENVMDKELKIYSKALKKARLRTYNNVRIVFYLKDDEEHLTSYLANLLLSKYSADIAVICRRGSVSFRSKSYNVRELAKALGGGGHVKAAGAVVKPGFLMKLLYLLRLRSLYMNWCIKQVFKALENAPPEVVVENV